MQFLQHAMLSTRTCLALTQEAPLSDLPQLTCFEGIATELLTLSLRHIHISFLLLTWVVSFFHHNPELMTMMGILCS